VVFIVLGYAITEQTSVLHQSWALVTTTRWILAAVAGFVLLMVAGVTSYKRVRSRMSYETWWVTHIYTYLAVVLAYMHQVMLGNAFVRHSLVRNAWLVLTFGSIACLVGYRWVLPMVRSMRHSLYVHAVVPEAEGVVSIWLGGRDIHEMKASGGQFFCWRFLTRELWWHAHPYSLSAPPQSQYLRITVKDLGDHSRALANLRPGTRVIAEGPYGAFTAERRNSDRVVLIGGGVGITPIRAVLEDLPECAHVEVLYRAPSNDQVVLQHELDALAQRPRTTVRYLVGSRKDHPMDARTLLRLVPHIANSDIYICGPEALHNQVRHALDVIGVPDTHIHDEAFAF
jgi:predicted ferric reductase